MQCPGHPGTLAGTVTHADFPEACIEDGYPPLPGDPGWPAEPATVEQAA